MKEIHIYKKYKPVIRSNELSVQEVEEAIEEYFDLCDHHEIRYTIKSLYLHIMTSLSLSKRQVQTLKDKEQFEDVMAYAKARIESEMELNALDIDSRTNSKFTEFVLKNNHGYEDKKTKDINTTSNGRLAVSLEEQIKEARKHFNLPEEEKPQNG